MCSTWPAGLTDTEAEVPTRQPAAVAAVERWSWKRRTESVLLWWAVAPRPFDGDMAAMVIATPSPRTDAAAASFFFNAFS
jgi:hypothetical protein